MLIAIGTRTSCRRSRICSRRGAVAAALSRASPSALGELAGARWLSSGPGTPPTATTRPTSRCRRAGHGVAREVAEDLAARALELPEVERAEVAGPGFLNLWVTDAFLGEMLAEIGPRLRWRLGRTARARAGRDGLRQPDGADHGASARNGALGDSVARLLEFAGHEVEREYYYNDAGCPDGRFRASVEAVRRGRAGPEDGYQGDYIAGIAAEPGDPVPRDARADRGDARAVPHPLRLVGEAERARARGSGNPRAAPDLRGRRGGVRPLDRVRRREGPGARAIRGKGRAADVRGRGRRLPPRQARARLRPRAVRARRRPPRPGALVRRDRPDARVRPGANRGALLPVRPPDERRRAREDVEAQGGRRVPGRLHRRGRRRLRPLVPRRSRPRPDDRDRRRPGGRTVAQEPRVLRPVRPRADERHLPRGSRRRRGGRGAPAAAGRPRSASSSSVSPSSRASSARQPSGAARMRSPSTRSGSPTTSTASTTSTGCWPRRGASTSRSASRSWPRRATSWSRCLDLVGVEAPEHM